MNKICTSIEQSEKLIELGIDVNSADMFWDTAEPDKRRKPMVGPISDYYDMEDWAIPAWSLSALLELMPKETELLKGIADKLEDTYMCSTSISNDVITRFSNTAIDAAFDMICWLLENKKL